MKRRTLLTLALVAGCGADPAAEHAGAVAELEAATGARWQWRADGAVPTHLASSRTGARVLAQGADPVTTSAGLLRAHRALFRMHDPDRELAPTRTERDALGMAHARFQQVVHGVPVDGAEVLVHYDAEGHLASIDASYVPDLDHVDVDPVLTVAEAMAVAGGDGETSLVVTPEGRLVYRVEVRDLEARTPAIWRVTVDAKTGKELERRDVLKTVEATGTGVLGQTRTFEVAASGGGGFVMTDESTGVQIRTFTAANGQRVPGTQVTSDSLTSWDTDVTGAGAAVDAHVHAAVVLQYFKDRHGRNAIDGNGGALVSTAHFGNGYENASWDGRQMIYGDGATIFRPLSAALDVVGHEFTHGVTDRTSKLDYVNQSGALNEAISDIFGAFIEHFVAPDAEKNWRIGETIMRSRPSLRDLVNPNEGGDPQPAHMAQFLETQLDNGGVHTNSGIVNNAAYLMTVGGTNPISQVKVGFGLGWEKSEKLWYRANTVYFRQTTTFLQAADALEQAGRDLGFNQAELDIVDCAFKATGIVPGACATLVDPATYVPGTPAPPAAAPAPTTEAPAPAAPTTKRLKKVTVETGGCQTSGGGGDTTLALALLGFVRLLRRRRA